MIIVFCATVFLIALAANRMMKKRKVKKKVKRRHLRVVK